MQAIMLCRPEASDYTGTTRQKACVCARVVEGSIPRKPSMLVSGDKAGYLSSSSSSFYIFRTLIFFVSTGFLIIDLHRKLLGRRRSVLGKVCEIVLLSQRDETLLGRFTPQYELASKDVKATPHPLKGREM